MPDIPTALTISALTSGYRAGSFRPIDVVRETLSRINACNDGAIWISRVGEKELLAKADELQCLLEIKGETAFVDMPLLGVPFAVKDNIDALPLRTTVACPGFSFAPQESATAVKRLEAAGAILIGKTNLDQFATGLVGVRSPYGEVRNPFNAHYISGGSSSGSAAATARGLVAFSLGTDTAGSGRVPAGFCNLVGVKPTRGLVSNAGVFPACKSLDCVSIFALDVQDAWTVLNVIAGKDDSDAYSHDVLQLGPLRRPVRLGVPDSLEFFGDHLASDSFQRALDMLKEQICVDSIATVSYTPFREAAELLYQGAWVAERRAAIGDFFDRPGEMDITVRDIIANAENHNAIDAFNDAYRLAELRKDAERALASVDILVVPTAPTIYTIEDVRREPITLNANLGYYTNFCNLLDMCALSLPAGFRSDGLPCGVTLIGPAGSDHRLADFAIKIQAVLHKRLGMTTTHPKSHGGLAPLRSTEPVIKIAVVGAHLTGQPLNTQLTERSARLLATTKTAAAYRLFALPGTTPPKPGLVRTPRDGASIEVEVWEMPLRHFGGFVATIPSPLGIGALQLASGETVKGFICEPWAIEGAEDITEFGGWRAYREKAA
ncbi:MAG TPA: allophanate hydrolase [Burkholderiales bacterium]|nr:allophanate hydrolase [Burkholderiales bacterium]